MEDVQRSQIPISQPAGENFSAIISEYDITQEYGSIMGIHRQTLRSIESERNLSIQVANRSEPFLDPNELGG